jgi:hypothetical protein
MKPMKVYVFGVVVALTILNYLSWRVGGSSRLRSAELLSFGFLFGMLAMYIAVHFYRWK